VTTTFCGQACPFACAEGLFFLKHGGKSWTYLLIPHDVIGDNKTLKGLAATYTWQDGAAPKR